MSELKTVQLPDIGDFESVEIIEVLVNAGDVVAEEDSLITVESDKASMEIPSPCAGTVSSVLVKNGDKVSIGSDLIVVEIANVAGKSSETASGEGGASLGTEQANTSTETPTAATPSPSPEHKNTGAESTAPENPDYDLLVIGAGPGGYTAAFRAADLGLKVCLVERYEALGGVCLNVGCIPSKALLHTSAIIEETRTMAQHGVSFGEPAIDIDKLRGFKEQVIGQLTGGLAGLAKQRKVAVVHGDANFTSTNTVEITGANAQKISFTNAIIAAGSQSIKIPGLPYEDERLIDSTGALALTDIPTRLLVIGGGIIGLEMGCVYAGLGSDVTVVELSDGLMPGCDKDLVRPLEKRLRKQFENIFLGSKVSSIESAEQGLIAHFDGGKAPEKDTFDRILLAVGRSPNGHSIGCDAAGVHVDDRGFIPVDSQQRTNVANIFAIGDIVGQPMLAHKATHEGKVAAEVAFGLKSYFDAKTIPSVAYTDPEVAWMGLTETAAKEQGITIEKATFPWAASGRSLSMARNEGITKIIYDPETKRLLGAGMVGPNAGELIAETVLALELGADIEDIALTVHPHPTLSETFNFAAEVAEGTVTDIYAPKKA